MTSRTGFAALLLALALLPDDARSQPLSQSFAELRKTISPGQVIWVTDDMGQRIKGRLAEISDSSLKLIAGRGPDEVVFVPERTARIERRDSLDNGIVFGLLGGGVLGWGAARAGCGYDDECALYVGVITIPVGIGAGIAAGALVDAAFKKTVYRSTQRTRVSMAPVIDGDRRGVHLSLSF